MDITKVGPIAALLLAIPVTLAAETVDASGPPTMVVRTFSYVKISSSDLQRARIQADGILRDAGIEISWLDCPVDHKAKQGPTQCSQALGATDLVMRIGIASGGRGNRLVSMGFSLVNVVDGTAPYLATVYADVVAGIARDADIDTPMLLGRAMAHEIGHLLLGTNQHAAAGLMRALWSNAELRHQNTTDWRFLANETQSLRAAVARRHAILLGLSPVL